VLLLLLALALPLLSWSIAGRRFWADLRGPGTRDLRAEVVARHGLTGGDADAVQTAVTRGRPVGESRLRPAATDWAGTTLTVLDEQHARHARRDRAAVVVLGLAGLCLLVALVLAVALDAGALVYLLVLLAGGAIANLALLPVMVRRNLQRAVTANAG
jgi:hypothetical protein